jgi:hypothetical protein
VSFLQILISTTGSPAWEHQYTLGIEGNEYFDFFKSLNSEGACVKRRKSFQQGRDFGVGQEMVALRKGAYKTSVKRRLVACCIEVFDHLLSKSDVL